jgi:hypothetical protein
MLAQIARLMDGPVGFTSQVLPVSGNGIEAPRRKRTRYQSGLESNSYLERHVVSPQTPLPRVCPAASRQGVLRI